MKPEEIPSLDLPGYPKPASFETVADYGGVRFTKPFSADGRNVEAGTYGTAARRDDKTCDVWVDYFGLTHIKNVPYEYLEATN